MAAPKKTRRLTRRDPNTGETSSDSDDNVENGNDGEMETINVDFDVSFPEVTDKHGIKNLLQQLFLKARINISELADLLIEQVNITGVIKEAQDDDDMEMEDDMDVTFGVFSIVNLTAKKNMQCMQQICAYLLGHCQEVSSSEHYENFKKIIEDPTKHVGLIISERFINIPAKIAVPLYAGLGNDMKTANEKQQAFDFEYYILISKVLTFNSNPDVYVNPEEELIAEEADFSFDFAVETEQDSGLSGGWTDDDDAGVPKRRVSLLPNSKWDIMYNKMVAELGNAPGS